jgi:CBS domain-containing protein
MRVQDVLSMKRKRLITISRNAPIQDAARLFTAERVGMLPVVDDRRRLAGLLFERDVIWVITTRGADALALPVSTAMSVVWLTASPQDSVTHVMGEMTERRARHVPVLSEGDLVGVISIGDVLKLRFIEENQEAKVQG